MSWEVLIFSSREAWKAVMDGSMVSTHWLECFKIWHSSSAIWMTFKGVSDNFLPYICGANATPPVEILEFWYCAIVGECGV
jgi:hypothetical protein